MHDTEQKNSSFFQLEQSPERVQIQPSHQQQFPLPAQLPPRPIAPPQRIPRSASSTECQSFERWFGGKALGIIAAVLVLAGLGMLGAVIIPQLSDTLKAVLVFAFAALLMGAGVALASRKLNAFTAALQLCGAGALVIAVLLARYQYMVINDTAAFGLLLLWTCGCLGAAVCTRSMSLPAAILAFLMVRGFGFLDACAPYAALGLAAEVLVLAQCAAAMLAVLHEREAARMLRGDVRNARIAVLVTCEIAILPLADVSAFPYNDEVTHVLFAAILLAMALLPIGRRDARYYLPLRVNEIVMLFFLALCWVFATSDDIMTALLVGAALIGVALLLAVRIRELPRAAQGSLVRKPGLQVMGALAFTAVFMGYLSGLTSLVSQPYAFSAVLAACALAAIGLGFRFRSAPLRLYGLVLTLLCTVKMVTIDTLSLDPMSRMVAFVATGLICFAASALYNYAGKRLGSESSSNISA